MKLKIGTKVIIRADVEELQNDLLEIVDGSEAEITEIYQNSYEPSVDRFEVRLDDPIEFHGERLVIVPGLYKDNLEPVGPVKESRFSRRVMTFESLQVFNRKLKKAKSLKN